MLPCVPENYLVPMGRKEVDLKSELSLFGDLIC